MHLAKKSDPLSGSPLPPGQISTRRLPVVGERQSPVQNMDLSQWRLSVSGAVESPLQLCFDDVLSLPQHTRHFDIHCVTGWSRLGTVMQGTPLRILLAMARPLPSARFVRFVAYSDRDHDTSLPLDVAIEDTWLVHRIDGEPLTAKHGHPLRTITPSRYFYKSLKWLRHIEVLDEDVLGFWERTSAYHNNADPWPGNQRYTSGAVAPKRLNAFKNATDFTRYHTPRQLLLHADLRNWTPRTRHVGAVHLKNSDLRGAQLQQVKLRGANLTRCDFRGADLRGADLRDADLEGALLAGADLRGADISGSLLSAARLFTAEDGGALVDDLLWDHVDGLLEDQQHWLEHTQQGNSERSP